MLWDFQQLNLLLLCLCNKGLLDVFRSAEVQRDRNDLEREDISIKEDKTIRLQKAISASLELVAPQYSSASSQDR